MTNVLAPGTLTELGILRDMFYNTKTMLLSDKYQDNPHHCF